MKLKYYISILLLTCWTIAFSQTFVNGDYRSLKTGNWTATDVWEKYNGTTWATTGTAPTSGNSNIVYIANAHTITYNTTNIIIKNLNILSGGTFVVSGAKLTINPGTITNSGTFTANDNTEIIFAGSSNTNLPALEFYRLTINKGAASNTVTQTGDITVRNRLTITRGKHSIGTNSLEISDFSLNTTNAELVGGNSSNLSIIGSESFFTLGNGNNPTLTLNNLTVNFDDNQSSVDLNFKATIKSDITVTNGILNIFQTAYATVEGDIIVDDNNGKLILFSSDEYTGSLMCEGTTSDSITIQRYMTEGPNWHIFGTPASGQSFSSFLTKEENSNNISYNSTSAVYAFKHFIPSTNLWSSYYNTSNAGNFEVGKGYSVRLKTIPSDYTLLTRGIISLSNKTVSVDDSGFGWNALANPYTSSIGMSENSTATENFISYNVDNLDPNYAAVYVWNQQGGDEYDYQVISNSGFTGRDNALGQDDIQVGQGFMAKVAPSTTELYFTKAMQFHSNSVSFKNSRTSWPGIIVKAKSAEKEAKTIVTFNSKMTNGLDKSYDVGLYEADLIMNIYTQLVNNNGTRFYMQCLPDIGFDKLIVPIGIDYKNGGNITFSADAINLPQNCTPILEDRQLGIFTSLVDTLSSYTVLLDANSKGYGRFYLHTNNPDLNGRSIANPNNFSAYYSNKQIFIMGDLNEIEKVQLFDISGKQYDISFSTNKINVCNLKNGLYILKVSGRYSESNIKILISN